MGEIRRSFVCRAVALLVVFAGVGGGVAPVAAAPPPDADGGDGVEIVDWWDDLIPSTPDDDPVAPPVEPTESAPAIVDEPFDVASADLALPAPGVSELTLGEEGEASQAASAPVEVAAESAAASGDALRLEVLDQQVTAPHGIAGFAFRVTGGGGAALAPDGQAVPVTLSVDYSGFAGLFGAGYSDRLRVVALPECALVDPVPAGCNPAGTPLTSRNERGEQRLVVEVPDLAAVQGAPLVAAEPVDPATPETPDETANPAAPDVEPAPADPVAPESEPGAVPEVPGETTTTTSGEDPAPAAPGSGAVPTEPDAAGMVLAVTAGPEGEEGSFKATPFGLSGDWQVGVGSGEFSWNYDLPVPAAPAGAAPEVNLAYSSGGVDSMVTSRNTQAGQAGLGWGDFADSFIERRYISCRDEDLTFSDLCWESSNASISLNGHASELVEVPGSGGAQWVLRDDPRWRVERRWDPANDDPDNPDDDDEHWVVTTPDGTQYFFGLGRNPGGTWLTESTWTVPVFGDEPGEPCHTDLPVDANDFCDQAWRWNLDRVVDPNGNTQTFMYTAEGNFYAMLGGTVPELVSQHYIRGGALERIRYGGRVDDPTTAADEPGMRTTEVRFITSYRCSTLDVGGACPQPSAGGVFPDVPTDLLCSVGSTCTNTTPTFFSAKRYTKVETWVKTGACCELVDTITLSHTFSDPDGDPATTDDAKLFLTGIQRTGRDVDSGATLTLPPTTFSAVTLNNRFNPAAGESSMPHWRIGSVTDEFGRQVNVTYGQPHPCQAPADPEDPAWDLNTNDCFPQLWAPEDSGEDPMFRAFNKWLVTQVEVKDTTGGSPAMVTSYAYGNQVAAGLANGAWHHDVDPFLPEARRSWSEWRGYQDVLVTQGQAKTRYRVFTGMNGDRSNHSGTGYRTATISSLDGTVTAISDDNWLAGRTLDEASLRSDNTTEFGTVHGYQTIKVADVASSDPQQINDARWVGENDLVQRRRTTASGEVFARRRTQTSYNALLRFPERVIEHGWTDQTGDERCTATGYAFNLGAYMLDYPSGVTRYAGTACSGTEVTRSETAYDAGTVGAAPCTPTGSVRCGNPTLTRTKITASPLAWATSTTTFDTMGRPLVATDPNGHTTTTAYSSGQGDYPFWVDVTNHLGHVQRTELTRARQVPVATVDANAKRTTYAYDPLGRVTSVTQPTEASGSSPSWLFAYDIDPNRAEVPVIRTRQLQDTNGSGGAARYLDTWVLYDSLLRERQTHVLSPAAGKVIVANTTYTNLGQVAETNLPEAVTGSPGNAILAPPAQGWANRTGVGYDTVGRPILELFTNIVNGASAVERVTTMVYTHSSAEVTPPRGGKTLTVTDAYDRTVRVEEHDGTAYRPTVYTYDPADRLVTVTDPASNQITYGYDMAGRRTAMDDPDAGDWAYGYDPVGNQTTVSDATAAVTATVYDALNRPTERRQDSPTGTLLASWAYDAAGELGLLNSSTRHHATGEWVIDVTGYDARNRPTGRTWTVPAGVAGLAGDYQTSYVYDAADHMVSLVYPAAGDLASEWLLTGYNSIGLPETMAGIGTTQYVSTAGYDDRARPALFGFGPAAAQAMGKLWLYNNNQQLTGMQAAAAGVSVQNLAIGYDKAGNVTERNWTLGAGVASRECFTYDQRQRLTRAYTTAPLNTCASGSLPGTGSGVYNHTYTYSHDGNLTSRVEGSTTIAYTYPAGGSGSTRPHAPTAVGANTYTWDANGHQAARTIGGQTETLTWDPEHRLAAIDDPDGDSSFVYDADGARLLRTSPEGSTLYIEGHEITAPTAGSTTAVRSYMFNGELIATRDATGVDYLATDNQGSVQVAVPAGSTTPERRTYQPYGSPTSLNANHDTDRAWIGQIEDPATALNYLNNRYYDPTTAIFLSPDPLADLGRPKTLNPYAYSTDNPTSNSDPTGLIDPDCALGTVTCPPRGTSRVSPPAPTSADVAAETLEAVATAEEEPERPVFDFEIDECVANCASFDNDIEARSRECFRGLGILAGPDAFNNCTRGAMERRAVQEAEDEVREHLEAHPEDVWKLDPDALLPPFGTPGEMIGERGTQTTSTTIRSTENYRIDVENPAPGARPGQMHLQAGANKYQFNFETGRFEGLPRSLARQLARDPRLATTIEKGLNILGMV